jgi:hypothetical protein
MNRLEEIDEWIELRAGLEEEGIGGDGAGPYIRL